jgi:hypothetical protein
MRISLSVILVFTFLAQLASAQDLAFSTYDWKTEPDFDLSRIDTSEAEVVLLEHMFIEYHFKGQQFVEDYIWHQAVYVNSDNAVERYNKQYIPANSMIESHVEKARVIPRSGAVREMGTKDVRKYENEESGESYRYFAVEGVEKGSIIEVFYRQTRMPAYKGTRFFFQREQPVYDCRLEIVSPSNLQFALKSYNGLPEVKKDTAYAKRNHYFIAMDSLPGLRKNEEGAFNSNRQFVIHKLDRNTATNANDFTSYGDVAKTVHGNIYGAVSKKNEKRLREIIKRADLAASRDVEDKVRTLETYVKENFRLVDSNADILRTLDFVLDNSLFSEWGAGYLMANLLKLLEIEHEIVLTTDRTELRFDPDFQAHIFLQDLLLYLPGIDKYIAPGSPYLRTGILPSQNAGNHGLFISEVKVGDFVSAIGQVRQLPETRHSDHQHNLDITVDLSVDPFKPVIHIRNELSGYFAQYTQSVYQYLNEEEQRKMLEEQMKYLDSEGKFENIVSTNNRSYNFGRKPFIIEADLVSESFTEAVGNNVMFRVGLLIGPQMEMYRELVGERTMDVESNYARNFDRTIRLTIPDGYEVTGMESLAMDHAHKDEQGHEMLFISTYELKGNVLTITIREFYANQRYPKELFAKYREVVNAAADFNKATIVLKKI